TGYWWRAGSVSCRSLRQLTLPARHELFSRCGSLHMTRTHWARAAVAAWAVLLAVVCARTALKPLSASIYPTFARAGAEFAAGGKLYDVPAPFTDNFRYSPLVAAGFVPFSL